MLSFLITNLDGISFYPTDCNLVENDQNNAISTYTTSSKTLETVKEFMGNNRLWQKKNMHSAHLNITFNLAVNILNQTQFVDVFK